jgi:hypothetical protein
VPDVITTCPACAGNSRAPESALGRKVSCPACKHVFTLDVPVAAATSPEPSGPDEEKVTAGGLDLAPVTEEESFRPVPREENTPPTIPPRSSTGNEASRRGKSLSGLLSTPIPASSLLIVVGCLLLLVGVVGAGNTYNRDTTVSVDVPKAAFPFDGGYHSGRVYNSGLVQEQTKDLIVFAGVALAGVVCVGCGIATRR